MFSLYSIFPGACAGLTLVDKSILRMLLPNSHDCVLLCDYILTTCDALTFILHSLMVSASLSMIHCSPTLSSQITTTRHALNSIVDQTHTLKSQTPTRMQHQNLFYTPCFKRRAALCH
uniref:Uncharacterized protein n=1 Tax=viral metagenome TaxID=1070528 RepID=A0A6C0C291_9ZZZZ